MISILACPLCQEMYEWVSLYPFECAKPSPLHQVESDTINICALCYDKHGKTDQANRNYIEYKGHHYY